MRIHIAESAENLSVLLAFYNFGMDCYCVAIAPFGVVDNLTPHLFGIFEIERMEQFLIEHLVAQPSQLVRSLISDSFRSQAMGELEPSIH
jgi:hypothetical protein